MCENMELDKVILNMTRNLYRNLTSPRSDTEFVIECFKKFITQDYNPFLLKQLNSTLSQAVDQDTVNAIERIFEKYKDPFEKFDSEEKRIQSFKHKGLYVEPEVCVLKKKSCFRGSDVSLEPGLTSTIHLSIKHSFKQLLQIKGLLNATLSYMSSLRSEENLITNFIQGSLWKKQVENFNKDGIVLPLLIYFDQLESVNAVYVTIPCFPPNFCSKLESIIISDIFYYFDKHNCDNKILFHKLISELNDLRSNGIDIIVDEQISKVYFITSLIAGKNFELDEILGFYGKFGSYTPHCRICNAGPEEIKTLTEENESLLRTSLEYELHVKSGRNFEMGISHFCIFNEVEGFNVIQNSCVDPLHELLEGNAELSKILVKLLDDGVLTVNLLRDRSKCFEHPKYENFGFQSFDTLVAASLDSLEIKKYLNADASTMLLFLRYLPLMVGEYVPEGNEVWSLLIKLGQIMQIVTSPNITRSHLQQLKTIIIDHHNLYRKIFGNLKREHHLLTHYVRIMLQNGPIMNVSSMRFKNKHRQVQAILSKPSLDRNVLKSIGVWHQLSLMNLTSEYKENYCVYGSEINDNEVNIEFPNAQNRRRLTYVVIDYIRYEQETIIVAEICENGPRFGRISKIFEVDNTIFFELMLFQTIGYSQHYLAYSVTADTETKKIDHASIPLKIPCLLVKKKDVTYIATKYII